MSVIELPALALAVAGLACFGFSLIAMALGTPFVQLLCLIMGGTLCILWTELTLNSLSTEEEK